jgi:hypothetical protein
MKDRAGGMDNVIANHFSSSEKEYRRTQISIYFFAYSFLLIILLFFSYNILMIVFRCIYSDPDLLDIAEKMLFLIFPALIVHLIAYSWMEFRTDQSIQSITKYERKQRGHMILHERSYGFSKERFFNLRNSLPIALELSIVILLMSMDMSRVDIFLAILAYGLCLFAIPFMFIVSIRTVIVNEAGIEFYNGLSFFHKIFDTGKRIPKESIFGVLPKTTPFGKQIMPGLILSDGRIRILRTGVLIMLSTKRSEEILTYRPLEIKSMFESKRYLERRGRL